MEKCFQKLISREAKGGRGVEVERVADVKLLTANSWKNAFKNLFHVKQPTNLNGTDIYREN